MKTLGNTRRVLACCAAMFAWMLPAMAQTYWQGPVGVAGDWTDTANWVGGIVPTGYSAIANGGIAEVNAGSAQSSSLYVPLGTIRINSGGLLRSGDFRLGSAAGGIGLLEMNGGSLMVTNWGSNSAFTLGYVAGSTGAVVMTSGDMNLQKLYIGTTGDGSFVLSNGTLSANNPENFLGGGAFDGFGLFLQHGGTYNMTNAGATTLQIGKGRYVLNEGVMNVPNVNVGRAAGRAGAFEVNGGTFNGAVYVATAANSTGTVVFTEVNTTLNQLRPNSDAATQGKDNSHALITLNNSVITNLSIGGQSTKMGYGSNSSCTVVQNGGATYWASNISLGFSAASTGTYTLTNNASMMLPSVNTVGDEGVGRLEIHGGNARSGNFFTVGGAKNGTGTVEMTDGSLTLSGLTMPAGTGTGTIALKGGVLKSSYLQNVSWQFYIGGKSAGKGYGSLVQTGGTFLVDSNSEGFYVGNGLYEISGGTLASTNHPLHIVNLQMPNVGTFRIKGSSPVVNLLRINATTNPFFLQFILDKSPGHIAKINFKWDQAYRCGHLRVGLDGGIVLSQTNAFTLIQWPGWWNLNYDYLSRPDGNMWTEATTNNAGRVSRITLANGYKQADLDLKGTASASFAARAMGHVTVANVQTNRLIELHARLAVTPGGKTLEALAADLVAAGYTNSVVESSGPYNLRVAIPADCVVDRTVKSTSYFLWDFTDPTTLATNATVTAVSLEALREAVATVLVIR